jgi:hypothetical protein
MSFVPTLCVGCWRVQLVSLAEARDGKLTCKSCEAPCRIAPGRSYSAAEQEGFTELSGIVAEARLSPREGRGYSGEAERALWSGIYVPLLERLSVRMPGLLPHQIAAGRNTVAQRSIVTTLKTVFDALATAPTGSAQYPIAALATRARGTRA